MFELGGKRQAIEVELSPKCPAHLREVIAEHSARYDTVLYYVGPRTRKRLMALKRDGAFPKLKVRDAPGISAVPAALPRRVRREPEAWEKRILKLISEQGAVPVDQLTRFLGRSRAETQSIVEKLERHNYAKREALLCDEAEWVWLKSAGNRLSGTSLKCAEPTIGALPRIRVLNEIRLCVETAASHARWASKRMLRREFGHHAVLPEAVVERCGCRDAILVRLDNRELAPVKRRIETFYPSFDSVTCYCATEEVRDRMAALGERIPSLVLKLEDLPSGF